MEGMIRDGMFTRTELAQIWETGNESSWSDAESDAASETSLDDSLILDWISDDEDADFGTSSSASAEALLADSIITEQPTSLDGVAEDDEFVLVDDDFVLVESPGPEENEGCDRNTLTFALCILSNRTGVYLNSVLNRLHGLDA